ncbi:MAG TPA: hypothetical protein VLJ39_04110, partial [Tepidisphaeraceae bacterium]|nr:hypothetical protein [Tepidisphaeraceae bacterium]
MRMRIGCGAAVAAAALVGLFVGASTTHAALTLTPQAISTGYNLSVFASGFPTEANEANGAAGPLGIVFPSNGVLVGDASGNVRVFPTDTDGQNAASFPPLQNYGFNGSLGLAQVGNNIYMTSQTTGLILQINPLNGQTIKTVVAIPNATGITVDPVNNHLFVSTYDTNKVYDVDPATGTATL